LRIVQQVCFNVKIVISVFGNFTRNITNLPKGLERAIACWGTYYLDPALSNMIERLWGFQLWLPGWFCFCFLPKFNKLCSSISAPEYSNIDMMMKLLRYGLWIKNKNCMLTVQITKRKTHKRGANSKDLFVSHFVIVSTLGNFPNVFAGHLKDYCGRSHAPLRSTCSIPLPSEDGYSQINSH
jgi:hypothetical protein